MFAKLLYADRDAIGWLIYKLVRRLLLFAISKKHVRLTMVGGELLPKRGPYVLVVAPHTSFMDGPLMIALSRRRWIGVGMAELLSWREWHVISLLFRLMGHIPVQRDNPDSRKQTLEKGIATLRRGVPVFISPPGRIRDPSVRDTWRSGYAKMAIETGAKVALVRVYGAKAFMDEGPNGEWIFDWDEPMTVVVGAVLDPKDYGTAEDLNAEAQRIFDSIQLAA